MQEQLTPLHFASREGHYDIARLLIRKKAELNARSDVSYVVHMLYISSIRTLLTYIRNL